jgi:hypothetical protein
MRMRPSLEPNCPTLLLAVILAAGGCGSAEPTPGAPPSGTGGVKGTGGAGGAKATGGSTGSGGLQSGGAGGGSGGALPDAAPSTPEVSSGSDVVTGWDVSADSSSEGGAPADAPPSTPRPDAMGQACATGTNYNFTIKPFAAQKGTFTAYFTASPGKSPSNSVIGLSDGMKYLHDDFSVIVRFGDSGNLDARNGTGYTSLSPIPYMDTDYHFRLVINVPMRTYAAYVTPEGKPEITIGTDLAFRDTAATPAQLSYWGVEAIAGHATKVCGFLVQ